MNNIKISGCGGDFIKKLNPGESKTVWINIPGDCGIDINYVAEGKDKKEKVLGYTTQMDGQKFMYRIGGKNTVR